jgi:O-antigen/teichoic acid export membrane protein
MAWVQGQQLTMSLARRSVTSVAWNSVSNLIRVGVLMVRSILLARMLPVETFGVYAFANSIIALTVIVPNFGMASAFLHRAPETEDLEQTASNHFTLKLLFTLIWAVLMVAGAFVFATGQTRTALLLLTATTLGIQLAQTPRLILSRQLVYRRLAVMASLNALLTTLVAVGLAWKGQTLWALLATDVVTLCLTFVALYVWRPVWRPRLTWSRKVVRYFLRFGSRVFVADALLRALDRVDDLWTGLSLGDTALGYYSKAYTFASYPRVILAVPINSVAAATYAELKRDRKRLSQAFFRTNALLVRSGFFLGGILALVAPEFIRLVLGPKWLPMLDAFRLMLVYTLLDPIKITVASAITVSGAPEKVIQARFIQLLILIAGLVALGPRFGIVGVAVAVDLMLVVGILLLLREARRFVDFSISRLFTIPTLALTVGLLAGRLALNLPCVLQSDWVSAAVEVAGFSVSYAGILFLLERENVKMLLGMLRRLWQIEKDEDQAPG